MHLTIGSVCKRQIQFIIPMSRILSVVDYIPFINVFLTVFKVPKNYRALTKVKLNSRCGICAHIKCCSNCTCNILGYIFFIYSNKAQTVKVTEVLVGSFKCYVVCTQTNLVQTAANSCLYGDNGSLTDGDSNNRLFKENFFGNCNSNRMFTHNAAVINHLCSYCAFSTVGCEYTVFNTAHSFFLNCPFHIGGDIYLSTNSVSTECIKCHLTSWCVIVIIDTNCCTSKFAVRRSSRNNQECISCRSLTAIGQRTVYLQIFTGTLRTESCRTAAVTVCSDNTAHLNHVVSHFIGCKTCGVGCLFTVGNSQHQSTVRSYTNECSGSNTCTVVLSILINRVAVIIGLYQETKQYGDCLFFPACQRICRLADPNLWHIRGSFFAGKGILVIVNNNYSLYTAGGKRSVCYTAVCIILTVQD